jgi:uncharacterized protein (DUF1499 family)
MPWLDGLTRNWAELAPDARDPRLRPVLVPLPPEEAVARAAEVIAGLARWEVVASDPAAGLLHATHATRVWRFLDDVRLRFEPDPPGTRIVGRSRSRIGEADFGQNASNLRELAEALRRAGVASSSPAVDQER